MPNPRMSPAYQSGMVEKVHQAKFYVMLPHRNFAKTRALAETADALGFHGVGLSDHFFVHRGDLQVPNDPRSSFNVGSIEGGTSVNSIPSSVKVKVDLRSEDEAELGRLEAAMREAMAAGAKEEISVTQSANDALKMLDASLAKSSFLVGSEPTIADVAVYGDVVYHHGAGFRAGELSPAHRDHAPKPALPLARPLARLYGGLRWRRWERSTSARLARESERVYGEIASGGEDWLDEFA